MTVLYRLISDQMVPMRDGVMLATDIYLPPCGKSVPIILERTPYGKKVPSRSEIHHGELYSREKVAAYYVAHGFAVAYQDCRGRYNSQGKFVKYLNEGSDGFDTIEWLSKQHWCDGQVATMGLSYAAHTQLAAACLNPPALKCMILDCGGFSNGYECGIRQGGAFELKQATWALKQAIGSAKERNDKVVLKSLQANLDCLDEWFKLLPWKPSYSPLAPHPEYEEYLLDQWSHEKFSKYWQSSGIYAKDKYESMRHIRTFFVSSWYDAYIQSTLENYNGFSHNTQSGYHKMVLGPWLHGDRNIIYSGNATFGKLASLEGNISVDWMKCRLDWFQKCLCEKKICLSLPIRLFVMGGGNGRKDQNGKMMHGGKWISVDMNQFAVKNKRKQYFLAENRSLVETPTEGPTEEDIIFQFDPSNPVPTLGGSTTSGQPMFVGGAFNQVDAYGIPLAARRDVISWATTPLESDLTIIGPVTTILSFSTDCLDTDFTAKLVDVYPPNIDYPGGYAMNITDGIMRCRFRDSWENPENLIPGSKYSINIELPSTANIFKTGHRIRLDISSSNFPRFDVNPNTGENPGFSSCKNIATNTVHMKDSRLLLPIVENNVCA